MRFQFNANNPTQFVLEICSKFDTNEASRKEAAMVLARYRVGARHQADFPRLLPPDGDTFLCFMDDKISATFAPLDVDLRIQVKDGVVIILLNASGIGVRGDGLLKDIINAFPFMVKMRGLTPKPSYPEKYYALKRESLNVERIVSSGSLRAGKARFRLRDILTELRTFEQAQEEQEKVHGLEGRFLASLPKYKKTAA